MWSKDCHTAYRMESHSCTRKPPPARHRRSRTPHGSLPLVAEGNDVAPLCPTVGPRAYRLLDDHLDHIITERRVEALRHLEGGRDLLAEFELRAIVGGAVDVGVRCYAQPHVRTCGLLDQQPPPLLL